MKALSLATFGVILASLAIPAAFAAVQAGTPELDPTTLTVLISTVSATYFSIRVFSKKSR